MDAPGTVLLCLTVVSLTALGFALWVAGRSPVAAVALGPLVGLLVIVTEESPPSRYDEVVILAITLVGASLSAASVWYLRWLMSRKGDVSGDVLGRPILPAPPFKATWMALAVSLAALAGLLNALP